MWADRWTLLERATSIVRVFCACSILELCDYWMCGVIFLAPLDFDKTRQGKKIPWKDEDKINDKGNDNADEYLGFQWQCWFVSNWSCQSVCHKSQAQSDDPPWPSRPKTGLGLVTIALCPIQKGTQNFQKGDQKGTWFWVKRGPIGDQKGTKKGTQYSSCSKYRKELICWYLKETESRRRKNYDCFFAFI